ncbi:hypothetical protein AVEN_166667-1 [Araneus ventricosus]|uniref:Uncharacterized protein n=1 Tax=Araneus ventricosus TaxID=182803 RepID=A0A4Y2JNW3_ARAVE|nr:hypothetical protein AVEN_166667-1 [Araneus ventricosus]
MTRTTPELASPLQTSAPHQREDVWPLRMIWRTTGPIHGGSSVESGFEPAALRSRGRDLTTRPPRPISDKGKKSVNFSKCKSKLCSLLIRNQPKQFCCSNFGA